MGIILVRGRGTGGDGDGGGVGCGATTHMTKIDFLLPSTVCMLRLLSVSWNSVEYGCSQFVLQ